MLAIKNNMMAANAARHLGQSYEALAKSTERLSSGMRINSAKDDAAGMAVRELVRADVAVLNQGSRNGRDAVSMLQTAEGAMGVIDSTLIRMKELAEQAATGSYSSAQRTIMNNEYTELAKEIDRIASSTSFNAIQLLATSATYKIHLGSSETVDIVAEKMDSTNLGVKVGLGTKEAYDNTRGVSRADDAYLSSAEISATAKMFKFRMVQSAVSSASAQISVNLVGYTTTGVSLNELVGKINTAWTAAGKTGTVAYAQYDTDSKQYKLRLENTAAGAQHLKVSASGIAILDNVNDFTNAANGTAGTSLTLATTSGATSALSKLTSAIKTKDAYRAKLGYLMNRLEAATSVIDIQSENLKAAESRISDVDVATEMAAMTRNQVLSQAGISMLSQANQMPQMALKLLG